MSSDISKQAINIFCDGGSRGNPGISGAGVVISGLLNENKELEKHLSVFLGTRTNNEAEYLALLLALKLILQIKEDLLENDDLEAHELVINMDSMLVVQQMSKNWKIKEQRMQDLASECWDILNKIGLPVKFIHIKRELNAQADWLANQAMDIALKTPDF